MQILQWPKPLDPLAHTDVCSTYAWSRASADGVKFRPYYVFLGCSRSRSTARALEAFEIEAGNTAGSGHVTPINSPALSAGSSPFVFPSSPASSTSSSSTVVDMPELSLGPAAIECAPKDDARRSKFGDLAFPLSSFHYHSRYELPHILEPDTAHE